MVGIEMLLAVALQAGTSPISGAIAEWANCTEKAAVYTARLDEPVDTAVDHARAICASENLAVQRLIDESGRSEVRKAEDMQLYEKLAGARAAIRVIYIRACATGDQECEAFFRDRVGMTRLVPDR